MIQLVLLALLGCNLFGDAGSTTSGSGAGSSSGDGSADASSGDGEKLTPRIQPAKQKPALILPGMNAGQPPAPEAGLTRGQCNDMQDGGPKSGPDCVTATIECGQTVIGHTRGGENRLNTRFYEANFCTPATTNHDGGDERYYKLVLPEGKWHGWVTLDSPCADLDVAAIQWNGNTCPTSQSQVTECDMNRKDGTKREVAEVVSDGRWLEWLIVVEGVGEEEGAFSITVQCENHL